MQFKIRELVIEPVRIEIDYVEFATLVVRVTSGAILSCNTPVKTVIALSLIEVIDNFLMTGQTELILLAPIETLVARRALVLIFCMILSQRPGHHKPLNPGCLGDVWQAHH